MHCLAAAELTELLQTNFGTVDWAIVAVYILASALIGVYANRYISKLSDFLVAGRAIRTYLGIATLVGTEIGLVTIMYASNDGYVKGLASFHIAVISGFAGVLIGLTGFVIYRLRQAGVMTIPEYYGQRYNTPVRWVGGLILAGSGILNMGLFLRAGADFVTAVTGLASQEWLLAIMTVLMVLVLLYTTLGGMVSIIITDLVQFIVLSFGLIIVSYFAINHIGWDNIVNSITERPDAPPLNPFAEGSGYGVMYFISMILLWVSVMALWQSGTLRALSARDPKTAKRIYFFASIGYVARFIIPAFWGVCAVAFLAMPENADIAARIAEDPAGAEGMLKPIQAMPVMLGHVVPSVLLGIVVAAMLAAFMSTHDSYLLCWAGVLTQDVVAPLFGDRISDKQRIWFTRAFIVAQGIFLLIWGLWYPAPASLWDYMATTGTVYLSGASAVVVCGLYWKRASNAGAMGALLFGLLALVPVFADSLPAGWLEEGTWTYKIFKQSDVTRVFAFAGSWVAMILFSLLIPNRGRTTSGQAE